MKKPLLLLAILVALASSPFTALGSSEVSTHTMSGTSMYPSYQGSVDGIDCSLIRGWAWNPSLPNTPINVNIYKNGSFYTSVPANLYRQDLLNAGIGNGYHAFSFNVPLSWRNGNWHFIQVNYGGTSQVISGSPRWITCGVAMFPTDTPDSEASGQGSTWEQATRFYSANNGEITHIRFYKHCSETGLHKGQLWTDSGTQLASVTFTYETKCGWQKAQLNPPVAISANVWYRVSYNINSYVAKTWNVFNSPITNGPLTASGSFYSTPAGSFPTTGSTSNLFADVLFNSPR